MVWLPDGKKNFEDMYNRLGTIPACDRQTDGQTSCHGIVRAMLTRRAVKMLAGVVVPGLWQRDACRSTWQPARQTTVCDERRFTICLLCAEVRAHHPATP